MTTAREETTRLADLLRREHHALADFLIALSAFDRERRWAELGHPSLFSFLRRELRLSAGAAQYRKTAAELVQKFPDVEAALRDGRLCLSSVIELAKVITPENAAEILPRFHGLSSRDAAFVAASIRPVEDPPRRDFIVTPVRPVAAVEEAPRREPPTGSEATVAVRAPELSRPLTPSGPTPPRAETHARPSIKPLDAERARVNMTVSRRLLDKLAAARDALSHSHPGASEEQILEVGLDLILQRHAKRRGLVERPRRRAQGRELAPSSEVEVAGHSPGPATPPRPAERSRYVPAAVMRAVWKRDGGRCQWPIEGGGVCGSTYRVELDHIDGWARGGETSVEECRLLCRTHQDVHARKLYGDSLMDRYTGKGDRCSEPVAVYAVRAPFGRALDEATIRPPVHGGALRARSDSAPAWNRRHAEPPPPLSRYPCSARAARSRRRSRGQELRNGGATRCPVFRERPVNHP